MKKKKNKTLDYVVVLGVSAVAGVLVVASIANVVKTPVQSVTGFIVGGMWITCAVLANKRV